MRWKKTKTGRVVYDRKFHPFGMKDVTRILGKNLEEISDFDDIQSLVDIAFLAQKGYNELSTSYGLGLVMIVQIRSPDVLFGGGTSGGGGATGEF